MTDYASIHQPVLLEQCVSLVAPALQDPGSIAVDCTLGLAGHTIAFLKAAPQARVLGIDRDAEALAMATERIAGEGLSDRFIPVHAAFDAFGQVLDDQGIDRVNAVFMDLGLSSLQIDETDRGFSYAHDAPLDMRMDVSQPLTAQRVLAEYPERELVRIFRAYGEERFSRQIAREIVRRRAQEPLTTSAQLNRLVDEVVPQAHRRRPGIGCDLIRPGLDGAARQRREERLRVVGDDRHVGRRVHAQSFVHERLHRLVFQ